VKAWLAKRRHAGLALTGIESTFLLVPDVTKGPLTSSRDMLR